MLKLKTLKQLLIQSKKNHFVNFEKRQCLHKTNKHHSKYYLQDDKRDKQYFLNIFEIKKLINLIKV